MQAAPFGLGFDRVESFLRKSRNRPFVMRGSDDGLAAMHGFRDRLGLGLQREGCVVDTQFTPHVTLLYDDMAVAPQPIEPIVWTVREFVLMHSLIGRGQHVPLSRWTLRG